MDAQPPLLPPMTPSEARPTVLIVDDVPENLQVLSHILYEHTLNVALAVNGQEALDMAARRPLT
jgi:CheY-like chemotaxis protein